VPVRAVSAGFTGAPQVSQNFWPATMTDPQDAQFTVILSYGSQLSSSNIS
jgi:hypothetical protein